MAAELRDHTAASCSSWAPAPISIKTINVSFYCSLTYIDTESLFFTEIYAIKKKEKENKSAQNAHIRRLILQKYREILQLGIEIVKKMYIH